MPTERTTDFLEAQRQELEEISGALKELIDQALPDMAGKIERRFAAINAKISLRDATLAGALSRAESKQSTDLDMLAEKIKETDLYVKRMRHGLEVNISDHLKALRQRILTLETRLS